MPRHTSMRVKFPTRKDEQGYLCALCGKRLSGRRTRWCSEKCLYAAWEQCDPGVAATQCEKRTNSECQSCGINTKSLERALHSFKEWNYRSDGHKLKRQVLGDILGIMHRGGWTCYGGNFPHWDALGHAHHIVKHCDGGPLHPSNLAWLCVPCHKKAHAAKAPEPKPEPKPELLPLFDHTNARNSG